MDLETLIRKFKLKDTSAFEQLYTMYFTNILGVVYNIVRNEAIAEEVTQDVFIKAWKNSHTYSEEKGRFFTWLLKIARNAAIDTTRSKAFNTSKKNLNADFFVNLLEDADNLDHKTDAIGIKRLVKQLTEKCIAIIELIYFKGYTQKETSKALNIPIGTVKTRNRNCLNDLRNVIEP